VTLRKRPFIDTTVVVVIGAVARAGFDFNEQQRHSQERSDQNA
jgi:hypothetical protein